MIRSSVPLRCSAITMPRRHRVRLDPKLRSTTWRYDSAGCSAVSAYACVTADAAEL